MLKSLLMGIFVTLFFLLALTWVGCWYFELEYKVFIFLGMMVCIFGYGLLYFLGKRKEGEMKVLVVDEEYFDNMYKGIMEELQKMNCGDVLFVRVNKDVDVF